MAILLDNKILEAAEAELEKQLLPEVREDYMKIVVAGMQAALHGGVEGMLAARLRKTKDPIGECARGAINLVVLLGHQSRGHMPTKAMIPASMTLMLQALDVVDRAKIAPVGRDQLVQATHIWSNRVMTVFKIPPQMLNKMADMSHKVMTNPTQMEMIKRRAGLVRDPRASTPTDMVQEK